MQLAMIGLGRMARTWPGGFLQAATDACLRQIAETVEELTRAKAVGASSMSDLARKLETPRPSG